MPGSGAAAEAIAAVRNGSVRVDGCELTDTRRERRHLHCRADASRDRRDLTTIDDLDDFEALEPFFRIIEEGLDGLVDGGHFFELLAEDVIFDYVITVPDYPRHIEGRQAVAELYRPYGTTFFLDRCYDLAVHHDPTTGVVVLEYASQGRVVATGAAYANRYISVLTIADRKVTRWRDYLDPVAVFDALGWPSH